MTVTAARRIFDPAEEFKTYSEVSNHLQDRFEFLEFLRSDAIFDYYKVEDKLSQVDEKPGEYILVLKLMQPQRRNPGIAELFRLQSTAGSKLRHPSIIETAGPSEVNGVSYCLLKIPEKFETLRDRLLRTGWLDPSSEPVWALILEISEAFRYAHGCGVLHLSLRPEEILIDEAESVHLMGFGFPIEGPIPAITEEHHRKGSDQYLSPEVKALQAGSRVDQQSDIYSLGVMLYEILTDRLPYSERDDARQSRRAALPPHLIADTVSPEISALILSMIDRDPRKRPATIEDFQQALIQLLDRERVGLKIQSIRSDMPNPPTPETCLDEFEVTKPEITEALSNADNQADGLELDLRAARNEMGPETGDAKLLSPVASSTKDEVLLGAVSESLTKANRSEYERPSCNEINRKRAEIESSRSKTGIVLRPSGRDEMPIQSASALTFHQSWGRRGRLLLVVLAILVMALVALAVRNSSLTEIHPRPAVPGAQPVAPVGGATSGNAASGDLSGAPQHVGPGRSTDEAPGGVSTGAEGGSADSVSRSFVQANPRASDHERSAPRRRFRSRSRYRNHWYR